MKRSLFALSCWLLAPAAFAILDTNSNGVSDFWEREFNNGNLFDVSFDPQGDADGDGWTNAQEAEADTNPFHPNPPDGMIRPVTAHIPQVWSEPSEFEQSYLISPEAVTVTWPTITGKLYTLQFSSTLMQGSWLPVGDAFVAYGGETTYGFEVSLADKCFWRVSVADIDEDSDGLTNHEEFLAGTDSTIPDTDGDTLSDHAELIAGTDPVQADADGDGWTDPQELAAGTDSRNQDTDGDGIPDPIDTEALISAFAFADADGDGIADGNDPQPTTARGPAPSVASETAFGNPLSNLIKDETVKFVLTVSNPAGPAPTASNLTFFLNGTEEPATITAIGTPIGSSQRFLLTWAAKTTANYATHTLQNLTLRFRDSQQATSWLKLARIDVAEWEGKMITLPFVSSEESWGYEVMTHQNGLKMKATLVSRNNGGNMVYRGPKTMKVTNANGETSDLQLPDVAIPFLKIAGSPGTPPNVVEQQDYATLATGMDVDFDFNNGSAKSLQFQLSQAGISTTLSPGQSHFDSVSLANAVLPLGTSALISYLDGADWRLFYSTYWPVANTAGANSRILRSVNVLTTAAGQLKLHSVTNYMDRDVKITPHASGTLDYPGLPQESVTSEYDKKYMPISSEEWRKVVIKIYPPQQHFTYSKGYRLTIGTGATGDTAPQTGWLAQTKSGTTFTPLTIPTDGKIEILATDTNLYPQLTSSEGLVLFLKRDAAVDQAHILSLDVLPIVETNNPVRVGALNILPLDLDVNGDGDITDPCDGLPTYMPGYELGQAKLHSGSGFTNAQYSGPQAMNIVMALSSGTVDVATVRIVSASEWFGYCGNGTITNESPILPHKDFTLTGQETIAATQEATVPITGSQMIIPIYCHDYGGWCEVEITLMKNGDTVGSPITLTLPRDDNGDKLADLWQRDEVNSWNQQFQLSQGDPDWVDPQDSSTWVSVFGSNGAEDAELADSDGAAGHMPAMADEGDGLKSYEEYRGFILEGGPGIASTMHHRLSIARKETLFQFLVMPQITDGSNPGNCANSAAQAFDAAQRFEAVQGFYNTKFPNGGADMDCYIVELPLVPDTSALVAYQDATTRPAYLPNTTLMPISGSTRPSNALTYVYYDQRLFDENFERHGELYSPDLATARDYAFMRARVAAGAIASPLALEHFAVCAFYNRFGKYSNASNWSLGVIERDPSSATNHLAGGTLSDPMTDPAPWMRGCQFAVNAISEQYPAVPAVQDFDGVMEYAIAHEMGYTLIWARDAGHPGSLPGLMANPQQGQTTPSSLSQVQIQDYEISRIDLRNRASVIK